ncbi:hypothetical protein FA15DRAFT_708557 [Coprinopsis marcescibilis]|uniref:Uncharacterized protein n=1 Tax=Coprinopsis marcescibilis TaxID=230819 RepID=A0A5C3KIG0_COPMA|nr:hypothetical protein FA15DRAFT_708557 [Coprinopsis marcescibilis]
MSHTRTMEQWLSSQGWKQQAKWTTGSFRISLLPFSLTPSYTFELLSLDTVLRVKEPDSSLATLILAPPAPSTQASHCSMKRIGNNNFSLFFTSDDYPDFKPSTKTLDIELKFDFEATTQLTPITFLFGLFLAPLALIFPGSYTILEYT